MQRWIKWLFGLAVGLVVVAISAIGALLFLIDPNIFKSDIQNIATEQGLSLNFSGDLSWHFFPHIQIASEGVSITDPQTPSQALISIDQAMIAVAIKPLLQKNIDVTGLRLRGVVAKLKVDEHGVGNWTMIGKPGGDQQPLDKADNATTPALGIHTLTISDASVFYDNAQTKQSIALHSLAIDSKNIQFDNTNFPVNIRANIELKGPAQTLTTSLALSGQININTRFDHVVFTNTEVELDTALKNTQFTSELSTAFNFSASLISTDIPTWTVDSLTLSNTSANYIDQQGRKIKLDKLDINGSLIPGGTEQALTLKTNFDYQEKNQSAVTGKASITTAITIDQALQNISLGNTSLKVSIGVETLTATAQLVATLESLSYRGELHIAEFNPRNIAHALAIPIPKTHDTTTLTRSATGFHFSGNDTQIAISKLNVLLDDTNINGQATLSLNNTQTSQIELNINSLNIDRYLPPKTAKVIAPTPARNDNKKPAEDLPWEQLNGLNLSAKIAIAELVASNIPISNVQAVVSAKKGLSSLAPLKGNIYDSPFSVAASINSRTKPTEVRLLASTTQLPIGKVLKNLEVKQELSGLSDVKVDINSRGQNIDALQAGLNGVIELDAKQLRLANLNIEKAYCQLVAALQKQPLTEANWLPYTDFQDTRSRIVFTNGVARIETLNAGVAKLAVAGTGKVNLVSREFDVVLKTRLSQIEKAGLGCDVNNEKLLNRDVPIRCRASFDGIAANSCVPDMRIIEDIAKEKVKSKFNEKAMEAIDKKMGSENSDAAKQLFNKYFKK